MKYFTSNPLEREMMQPPQGKKWAHPPQTPPKEHFCYGCGSFSTGCVRPCYRDAEKKK